MAVKTYTAEVIIPSGINVSVNDNIVKIKGQKGEVLKTMKNPRIQIVSSNEKIIIKTKDQLKSSNTDKMFINSYRAHIRNMLKGVQEGYIAKLKICSGHFPMQVAVSDGMIQIKNFLGEKVPRKRKISEGVTVKVQGDTVTVEGIDKEKVAQMAANIEQRTRISDRDRRIFQDGIFIISKPGDVE